MRKHIPIAKPSLGKEEEHNLISCIESTWISSSGRFITEFEQQFAAFCGTNYALSATNGTAALHLALLGLGIGRGDEVIVPTLTYVSCANAVRFTGAAPVFADVDPLMWTIDPYDVEKKITRKTRAILPVHLYGYPADMHRLKQIADEKKLFIIEDAAEAHGATLSVAIPALSAGAERKKNIGGAWQKVGSIGDVGCFSFYGNKIITTGEGGMVVTDNKKLAEKIALFRGHGQDTKKHYYHRVIGHNYRMTNMQAAVGLAQLQKIDRFLKRRQDIYRLYRILLKDIPGIILPPSSTEAKKGVCWLFSALVTKEFGMSRNQLTQYLHTCGIESKPFFTPLHLLPMYCGGSFFPIAEQLAACGLSLPTYVDMTDENVLYIVKCIQEAKSSP